MQLNPTLIGIGTAILLLILTTTASTAPPSLETKERGVIADRALVSKPLNASSTLGNSPRIKAPSRGAAVTSPSISSRKHEMEGRSRAEAAPPPHTSRMETLSVAPATTKEIGTLRAYGNEIATILIEQGAREHLNARALNAFIEAPSNEHADLVRAMSSQYEQLAKQFETMRAPEATVSLNEELSSDYQQLAGAAQTLSTKRSSNHVDVELDAYNDAALQVAETLRSLFTFFKDNNVQFSPQEPGFIFTFMP